MRSGIIVDLRRPFPRNGRFYQLYVIMKSMEIDENHLKLDKTSLVISSLEEPTDEIVFWSTKSPIERMAAIELMRQIIYGYDPTSTRLQRVLTITQRT